LAKFIALEMAQFLHDNNLNAAIENIFRDAKSQLILISPYIKLHDRYKHCLLNHKNNDKLEIIVVFGKNEANISKSMSIEDLNFFKDFPNVQIRHEKRLHAKYYANEITAVITSMNLYSFSQDNNIEAGVLVENTLLGNNTLDNQSSGYFEQVIEHAELLFRKRPVYDNGILGLQKKYTGSKIELDNIPNFFEGKHEIKIYSKSQNQTTRQTGYCIRTGEKIPFNPQRPFSAEAFQLWNKYANPNFPEKYCHYSGELSNKQTSFSNPILTKNLKKA
jgi:hypothetical protein